MAKVAAPYMDGAGWAMRRRIGGHELFISGQSSPTAARKAMEARVKQLEDLGKPRGLGASRTTVAQALQDYALDTLPFKKGARQEAHRINDYLRAAGLRTVLVVKHVPTDAAAAPAHHGARRGQLFDVTLGEAVPERRVPRSLATHRRALAQQTREADRLQGVIARMRMADLQPYHVQAFLSALRAAGRSPATLQLERSVLRVLFNHAKNVWRWAEPALNPAVGIRLPAVNNQRDRVMSAEEEQRLDEAIAECRNGLVGPAITLLTETAMRSSEPLQRATWSDIDWERKLIRLKDSKSDQRDVPLSPRALEALRALKALSPCGPSDPVVAITYEALKAAWRRACERAGVSELKLHDLRHTSATRMALRTGNVFLVKALTGHKTMSQVERYVNVKADDVVRVMHAESPDAPAVALSPPTPVAATDASGGTATPALRQQGNVVTVNFMRTRVA